MLDCRLVATKSTIINVRKMMLYPSHNVTLNVILMPLFLNGVSNDDHNKKKESFGFRRFVLFVFVSHLPFNLFVSVNKLRR